MMHYPKIFCTFHSLRKLSEVFLGGAKILWRCTCIFCSPILAGPGIIGDKYADIATHCFPQNLGATSPTDCFHNTRDTIEQHWTQT